jgi:hypothetical protein
MSGSKWALRTLQQTRKEPRRLRRLDGFLGFQSGFYLGLLLAMLAGEPFVQAHAGLGGALGFVGFLAFGECLWRWHFESPGFRYLVAGAGLGIKYFRTAGPKALRFCCRDKTAAGAGGVSLTPPRPAYWTVDFEVGMIRVITLPGRSR